MFQLYTQQTNTFPFADYEILLDAARGKKSALEFGPGHSTYALIEAGVERIVSCEHNPEWAEEKRKQFAVYPQVEIVTYRNISPAAVCEAMGKENFDIAFVDAPQGYIQARTVLEGQEDCSRLNTLLAALERAPIVYLHDALRPLERQSLNRLRVMGHIVTLLPPRMARIDRWLPD